LTDSSGTLQTQYTYEPFGSTTVAGTANTNPFQYTGRENDGIGLYYYRARFYSPRMQRFISEDPIGFEGGINFYAYTYNNPLNFVDPNGLDVTVTYYPYGAYTLTHVGLGVNTDATVSFGPEVWDTSTFIKVFTGQDVPGSVQPDDGRTSGGSIRISTSPQQDQAILDAINARIRNPGNYNLAGRNCALFVQEALRAGGIPVPDTMRPDALFNFLKQYADRRPRLRQGP
jgi:RHS repeat-associated protein